MVEFKSFRFFTESSKAKMLFRYIVRLSYRVPPADRIELRSHVRTEFQKYINESDPEKIRFLVGEGLKRAREVDSMLSQLGR